MSNNSKSCNSDNSFDIEDLFQIGAMRMELRKEKDMLRGSPSNNSELIKGLELKVESLSQARMEDRKYIQELESELQNCSEEIETLRGELNLRSIEANWLGEHVHSLELKLTETSKFQENENQLREELLKSNSECLILRRELENKEMELHNSTLCIEKLEEVILSMSLESECEIESMKLDLLNSEHIFSEAKEKSIVEKIRLDGLLDEFSSEIRHSQRTITFLEEENVELKNKLETLNSKDKMEKMAQQIDEYKNLVDQLKDELKKEKLKAKDEAEDLTQEMAELRYQTSNMLEEECRRRANIEQASLQRISELEALVQREKEKSRLASNRLMELQKLEKKEVHKCGEVDGVVDFEDDFVKEDRFHQLTIVNLQEQRHLTEKSNYKGSIK
ncbi:hypothetical protein ACHQM5_006524 [Ranunculus cassubicifolius]